MAYSEQFMALQEIFKDFPAYSSDQSTLCSDAFQAKPLEHKSYTRSIVDMSFTMKAWFLLPLLVKLSLLSSSCRQVDAEWCDGQEQGCKTKALLDGYAQFRGEKAYPNKLWQRLKACWMQQSLNDIDIIDVQDKAWGSFVPYMWNNNPVDTSLWLEYNPTYFATTNNTVPGATTIRIGEPCNAVSNLAYYRTALFVCEYDKWTLGPKPIQALVRSFSLSGYGSTFFHSNYDDLSGPLDVIPIQIFALVGLQGALQKIPYDPILFDVGEKPLPKNGVELAETMTRILLDENMTEWEASLRALVYPDYVYTFAVNTNLWINLVFSPTVATNISTILLEILAPGDDNGIKKFLLSKFEPTLQVALSNATVHPGPVTRFALLFRVLGFGVKMLYAFLWQEGLVPGPHLTSRLANRLGGLYMPFINKLGNTLTGYERGIDWDVQWCINVYPGDFRNCRVITPHAKWHEQTANALSDMALLNDDTNKIISGQRLKIISQIIPFACFESNNCMADFDLSLLTSQFDTLLETCFPYISDTWPNPDVDGFKTCLLMSVLATTSIPISAPAPAPATLDTCLVQNDCLQFLNFGINTNALTSCIGLLRGSGAKCSKYAKSALAATCIAGCQRQPLCIANCLQRYGTLSPAISAFIGCLNAIWDPESVNVASHLQLCNQAVDTTTYPMLGTLMQGLPKMAGCTTGACRSEQAALVAGAGVVYSCAHQCVKGTTGGTFPFPFLPRGMNCVLECYLKKEFALTHPHGLIR